jgi:flavin prenyltransferase
VPAADPIVLAISGASAQPLAQRALQLLLEAGETVEVVTSKGAIGVWQAELGIRVPLEPRAQEAFWRERTGMAGMTSPWASPAVAFAPRGW